MVYGSFVRSLSKSESVVQHLMTCYPAEVVKPGELIIHYAPEGAKTTNFLISYNPAQFEASVEKIKMGAMEDKGVLKNWGETIRRISLRAKTPKKSDQYKFRISRR